MRCYVGPAKAVTGCKHCQFSALRHPDKRACPVRWNLFYHPDGTPRDIPRSPYHKAAKRNSRN